MPITIGQSGMVNDSNVAKAKGRVSEMMLIAKGNSDRLFFNSPYAVRV